MSNPVRAVERWLAWRYLATRQREGFVSFIAIFSLIGVALGVATLIVVLSVMGGFREQLLGRIIGLNGHIVITARDGGMAQATAAGVTRLKCCHCKSSVNFCSLTPFPGSAFFGPGGVAIFISVGSSVPVAHPASP